MNKTQNATDAWFRNIKKTQLQEMCSACGGHHQVGDHPEEPHEVEVGDSRKVVPNDQEGRMAKQQLFNTMEHAQEVLEYMHDDDELEAWVQSKITKISSMMSAVNHYLKYEYKNNPLEHEE